MVTQPSIRDYNALDTTMGYSHDVKLPRDHTPVFPDRCVACCESRPDHTMRFGERTLSWATALFFIPGRKHSVEVPICRDCLDRTRPQRTVRNVISWIIIFTAVGAGVAVFAFIPRTIRKWVVVGVAILCFLPYAAWQAFRAPAFDLTVYKKTVDYEFANHEFAVEFAELNGKSEWDIE